MKTHSDLPQLPGTIVIAGTRYAFNGGPMRVLCALRESPGETITGGHLLAVVGLTDSEENRQKVRAYIAALRRVLGKGRIATVLGVGYKWQVMDDERCLVDARVVH